MTRLQTLVPTELPTRSSPGLEGGIPGMRPGTQKRSRELVERLFASALKLLRDRDFDALTIDDLCVAADATVGSFYARFENKQAFILALQHRVYERTMRSLARDRTQGRVPVESLEAFVAWICRGTVAWFRHYEGFIRASSKRRSVDPAAWEPLRVLGAENAALCLPVFRQIAGADAAEGLERAVRSALQVLYGTLNNIVLIDPGPLRLHDADTENFLNRLVLNCVREGLCEPQPSVARKSGAAKARKKTKRAPI